jgi:DtxR family Mn-dependent transcriptional regulator
MQPMAERTIIKPVDYETPEHHPAFEEYSETIFELKEDGLPVIQARIAERLEVSRPAVSEMIKRMEAEGLIKIDTKSHIALTKSGLRLATAIVRRHRLAERFLTDVLRLSWAEAHHEAGKWEHVISPTVETALIALLENPETCPHGNPIPGSAYQAPKGNQTLADTPVGSSFKVSRIPEELEFEPGQLEFLEEFGLMPGRIGRVETVSPDGTLTLTVNGKIFGLSAFAANRILATPEALTSSL